MRKRLLVGATVALVFMFGVAAAALAAGSTAKNFNAGRLGSKVDNESQVTPEVCGNGKGWHTWEDDSINKPATSATIVTVSAETTINSPHIPQVRVLLDGTPMPPVEEFSSEGILWAPFGEATSFTFVENNAAGGHSLHFQIKRGCVFDFSNTVIY